MHDERRRGDDSVYFAAERWRRGVAGIGSGEWQKWGVAERGERRRGYDGVCVAADAHPTGKWRRGGARTRLLGHDDGVDAQDRDGRVRRPPDRLSLRARASARRVRGEPPAFPRNSPHALPIRPAPFLTVAPPNTAPRLTRQHAHPLSPCTSFQQKSSPWTLAFTSCSPAHCGQLCEG